MQRVTPKGSKPEPEPKPDKSKDVQAPKSNIVEQAPFVGFMLDELMREQRIAMIPIVQMLDKVRQEVADLKHEIFIRKDEGEYRYYEATASIIATDYDFIRDFGFPIKGMMISNDGNVDIQVGYMSYKHLLDVPDEKLITIRATDGPYRDKNNTKTIRRILVQTEAGTSDYRLWVYW